MDGNHAPWSRRWPGCPVGHGIAPIGSACLPQPGTVAAVNAGERPASTLVADGGYAPAVVSGGRTPSLVHGHELRDGRSRSSPYPIWRILAISSGPIGAQIDGDAVVLHRPTVLLLRPGVDPGLAIPDEAIGCHCSFLVRAAPWTVLRGWSSAMRRSWRPEPGPIETWGVDLPVRQPDRLVAGLLRKMHRLTDCWWRGDAGRLRANAILADILCDMVADRSGAADARVQRIPNPASDQRLIELLKHLERRLRFGVSVADLMRWHGSRRTVFYAWCRSVCGCAPGDLIDRVRRDRASAVLARGGSARDAARMCGFKDYATFYRRFRIWFGASPRQWVQSRSGAGSDTQP